MKPLGKHFVKAYARGFHARVRRQRRASCPYAIFRSGWSNAYRNQWIRGYDDAARIQHGGKQTHE